MSKVDLTIIIPARNEMFLARTVQDALKAIQGKTEIIIGCDGNWPDPPIEDDERVHILYHNVSIGQRAITNEAARLSRAKYLMKVDAHCTFDDGFDVKMMADMHDDWTMVPIMRNLHAFDWVCKKCGDKRYQGPTPTSCPKCDNKTEFERQMVWIGKNNPQSTSYCFDPEPHFQYFRECKDRPGFHDNKLTETMSLQGSCFMVTREKFHELNLCDEAFGSWGSQGIEVAVKTWLSGGRVICNHKTWYAHMFRTQGGDFGFPYDISGRQVDRAKKYAHDLFFNNRWDKQIRPLSWLIDKFWPIPGWSDDARMAVREAGRKFGQKEIDIPKPHVEGGLTKGLCFYTDNRIDKDVLSVVKNKLLASNNGYKLVTVSQSPLDFGDNIVMSLKPSHLSMAKQQLAGLEALNTDIVFMVEHDVIYPPCHFTFVPPRKDVFYYNLNWWKVRMSDGQALHFKAKQVSGLCAYRDILIEYFRNRVRMIESGEIGGRRHFEPGSRYGRSDPYNKLTSHGFDTWFSEIPYVDIRHEGTVSRNVFDPSGYRGQVVDWTMADSIPNWGATKGRFSIWLQEVKDGKYPVNG